MNTVSTLPYSVSRLPAFNDNYLWLIDDGCRAITVDPGDAEVVKNALIERDLQLDYILTTHHHGDHTVGVSELQAAFDAEVIGPDGPNIPQVTQAVDDGQMIELMGITFTVIAVPGHTLDHIAYFAATPNPLGQPILFCGDTLFAGGEDDSIRYFTFSTTQLGLDPSNVPTNYSLKQNYPNPFNHSTTIEYHIAKSEFVSISIFDLAGNRIKSILNLHVDSGLGYARWDGKNELGQNVSGGI